MSGTITLSTPVGELTGPVEVLNQAPNKARTLIKLDLAAVGAGEMTIDQRFDGTAGIVMDSMQGNRDISGEQLDSMRNATFPSPFLDYKERGVTVELGPQREGRRARRVRADRQAESRPRGAAVHRRRDATCRCGW